MVTREGNNIFPDRQIMLFARDVLTRVPGGQIIYDVKCSQQLAVAVRAAGGVPVMYKTGHSLVKAKLKETGAPFAGLELVPEDRDGARVLVVHDQQHAYVFTRATK